jgi:hypothetical protein
VPRTDETLSPAVLPTGKVMTTSAFVPAIVTASRAPASMVLSTNCGPAYASKVASITISAELTSNPRSRHRRRLTSSPIPPSRLVDGRVERDREGLTSTVAVSIMVMASLPTAAVGQD